MARFLNYLNESRTKSIDYESVIDKIITNCSKNYKKLFNSMGSVKLYRGVWFDSDFGYIDSNKGSERKSANTDNYYTWLLDNLPSWKSYPKRSRGLICSTDKSYTTNYGNEFYIIPYDNAKVGVCSSFDIWISFKNRGFRRFFSDLDELNSAINSVISKSLTKKRAKPKNYEQLKDVLIQISKLNKEDWLTIGHNSALYYLFFDQKDIMKHLNDVLDPDKNGFKIGINNISENKEVWIQGESVLISDNGYSIIENDLHKHL